MTCEILLNFAFEGSIAPHSSWSIMGIHSVNGKSKFFSPTRRVDLEGSEENWTSCQVKGLDSLAGGGYYQGS